MNVQGYYGCSHWTISRHLLGLPIMGKFDQIDNLPFKLIFSLDDIKEEGHYITETHPALAMYLLLKHNNKLNNNLSFDYKKNKDNTLKLFDLFCVKYKLDIPLKVVKGKKMDLNDDDLDAFVCYTLAKKWVENQQSICHVGDAKDGSFLLPNIEDEKVNFLNWKKSNP